MPLDLLVYIERELLTDPSELTAGQRAVLAHLGPDEDLKFVAYDRIVAERSGGEGPFVKIRRLCAAVFRSTIDHDRAAIIATEGDADKFIGAEWVDLNGDVRYGSESCDERYGFAIPADQIIAGELPATLSRRIRPAIKQVFTTSA